MQRQQKRNYEEQEKKQAGREGEDSEQFSAS